MSIKVNHKYSKNIMKEITNKEEEFEWLRKQSLKTYQFYFEQLVDSDKMHYRQIFYGILDLQKTIRLSMNDSNRMKEIYHACIEDNPLFFYVNGCNCEIYSDHILLFPSYYLEKETIRKHLRKIRAILSLADRDCNGFDVYQKEEYVHRCLIKNVKYDKTGPTSIHYAQGVFSNRVAVCDGISKAAKIMLDHMEIPAIVINGDSSHPQPLSQESQETGEKVGHAWNIVWLHQQAYHVDFTFDNNLTDHKKYIRYDYLNLSDEQICKDHIFKDVGIRADYTHDWFRCHNRYFDKKSKLRDYLASHFRRESEVVAFRLPLTNNPQKTIEEIEKMISEELRKCITHSTSYRLSINYEQMIIYIIF